MRSMWSRLPSAEARYQLLDAATRAGSVQYATSPDSLESHIAEWFLRRARAAFLHATWTDDARYGGVE